MTAASSLPPVHIAAGMSIDAAIAAFRAGCNHPPERLWITDSWIAPRFDRLRELLSNPITDMEAEALRETVLKKRSLDSVIEWLTDHRSESWEGFRELTRRRATEAWKALRERGFFPWEDVDACRVSPPSDASAPAILVLSPAAEGLDEAKRRYMPSAVPCSKCGAAPEQLTWIHFISPAWTWEMLCGRAGWLTVCERCHLQVDFFTESMN
jgi:hypothetical protein